MLKKSYCRFICLLTVMQVCQCSFMYDKVGETSYFIAVGFSDEHIFDWFDARKSCRENDGELVSVVTSDQMLQLQDYILSKGYANGSTFGTSGHSYDSENPFKWEALDQRLTYTKWLPGEAPPADCNLSLQLIDSELYMIRSWGYDPYYICEYTTPWRRMQTYFHQWKFHILVLSLLLAIVFISSHKTKTKDISNNRQYVEIKKNQL
ncbi:uncharacterized protein LOC117780101 [Drosophila innubila]|uniref:uncharacterized protein LOC117780101 n=1 Tax=Drosophila innubila TaxID=198719 RepID=UPI00148D1278|nr:uncharacterized protein LOC117780101 [Drosophila innubila]